jgi:CHAD domain-containing protein
MPLDQDRTRAVFEQLDRQLSKLAHQLRPDDVHRYRTCTRRLQALLEEVAPKLGRNERKLLKALNRLRRRAGRVRDLDVQIAALRNLKIPQEPGRKALLLHTLAEMRSKREKKLHESMDSKTLRGLRKRVKKAASNFHSSDAADPIALARTIFAQVARIQTPLTEEVLHRYRLQGKRVRYVVELAGETPEAEPMLQALKQMQDVLGDWHDWLTLSESAVKILHEAEGSALLTALRNVTRAKYRHAVLVVTNSRAKLLSLPKEVTPDKQAGAASSPAAQRKPGGVRQVAVAATA